ncbi:hypothetical protein NL676_031798 [Syzygium grande]|nr:hypothetical protein NL676_031798 [Syzygium grande]
MGLLGVPFGGGPWAWLSLPSPTPAPGLEPNLSDLSQKASLPFSFIFAYVLHFLYKSPVSLGFRRKANGRVHEHPPPPPPRRDLSPPPPPRGRRVRYVAVAFASWPWAPLVTSAQWLSLPLREFLVTVYCKLSLFAVRNPCVVVEFFEDKLWISRETDNGVVLSFCNNTRDMHSIGHLKRI